MRAESPSMWIRGLPAQAIRKLGFLLLTILFPKARKQARNDRHRRRSRDKKDAGPPRSAGLSLRHLAIEDQADLADQRIRQKGFL